MLNAGYLNLYVQIVLGHVQQLSVHSMVEHFKYFGLC
jgi:hypothetical protein